MLDRKEQKLRKKLSIIEIALENPFENLEKIVSHLEKEKTHSDPNTRNFPSFRKNKKLKSNFTQFKPIFSKFDELLILCQKCGRRTLYDELISGICFICHNQEELNDVEKELKRSKNAKNDQQLITLISRLGELETQMKSLENKQQELTSKDYLSTVIEEISGTVRDSITSNLNQFSGKNSPTSSPSSYQAFNPPPPPPPPGAISSSTHIPVPSANISHVNFAELTLADLSAFSPQMLNSMSLDQRNKYTLRLKELQRLEKMSPSERKTYLREKASFKQQHSDRQNVISSLEDLSNPLFKKMKEQADKTILAGKGTFGFFTEKKVFVHCHNCNKTNQIIDGEEATCEMCNSPLNTR